MRHQKHLHVLAVILLSACAADGSSDGQPSGSAESAVTGADIPELRQSILESEELSEKQKEDLLAAEVVDLEPIDDDAGVAKALKPTLRIATYDHSVKNPTLWVSLHEVGGRSGIYRINNLPEGSREYKAQSPESGSLVGGEIAIITALGSHKLRVRRISSDELIGTTASTRTCYFDFFTDGQWIIPRSCN